MKKHDSRADRISTLQKAIEDKIEDIYKSEGDNNKIDTLVQTIAIYSQELELQNLELQRVYGTLEKSHKLYSSIFLNSPNGYVVCNANLRVKEYSKFFEEGLNVDLLEKDIHISTIIDDKDKEIFISNIKQLTSTSKVKKSSFECNLINGIPVKISFEIIDINNESLYLLIFTDITKERESILSLNNHNKRLHDILDKIPFKIYVVSKEYDIQFANKSIRDINGDYFGKKCYTYVNHKQQPCPWCKIDNVFKIGYNKRLWKSPIDNRSYILHEYPITNLDTTISKMVILDDVTDEVRSRALQKVQYETLNLKVINNKKIVIVERFKEILKNNFLRDSESVSAILFDNPNEFSIDPEHIAKLPYLEKSIASSLYFKRVVKERYSILIKGDEVTEIYNILSPQTTPKDLLLLPIAIEDNFFGVLIYANYSSINEIDDTLCEHMKIITLELAKTLNKHSLVYQLIAEKENAQRSDMLKTTFLANMSHEIRTPLNSIIGFTQLIEESNNKEEINDYIKVINECSDRLLATINDIIDYSKIESGYLKIEKSQIDICNILKSHLDIFNNQASAKNISINISCSNYTQNSIINSDLTKINSIFTNLIKNAIKFTDIGEIIIGCKELDEEYLFYVKDSGIGIPSEKLDMLFDRFYQVDAGKTRKYEGSGLGLPITKAYIELL